MKRRCAARSIDRLTRRRRYPTPITGSASRAAYNRSGRRWSAFAWIVVRSQEMIGKGRTGTFFLPPAVVELIRQGKELGEADDIVFGRSNSKQDNGAVGLLTDNVIDRAQLYEHAMILALIPFKNETLYAQQGESDA